MAVIAALFRTGQVKVIAQRVQQCGAAVGVKLMLCAIDR
ncbi:MAG: hypothetical protein ACJAQV_001171 [Loktanella salsilacus]